MSNSQEMCHSRATPTDMDDDVEFPGILAFGSKGDNSSGIYLILDPCRIGLYLNAKTELPGI